ncbi:hypothetical protein ES332_D07G233400v1 [Gossypium tomentosum]|uniref:Secreted protein n=1 Tax=Gossypium tomentosum TaxID=34277 RepID=A0A5D2KAI8_GOSTO|nr:hypothetical protein ES332_D07G233400v1 [Gossypium tomentosum]
MCFILFFIIQFMSPSMVDEADIFLLIIETIYSFINCTEQMYLSHLKVVIRRKVEEINTNKNTCSLHLQVQKQGLRGTNYTLIAKLYKG